MPRPVQRERDFLEELERSRTSLTDAGVPDQPATRRDEPAASAKPDRSGVEPVPLKRTSYDPEDLEIPSFLRRNK
jgi:hypothetical protein